MARATKVTKTTEAVKTEPVIVAAEEPVIEERKFLPEDMIPVVSITPGEMFFNGVRSKILYTWADADDCIDMEYRDLEYAVRSKDKMMFKPRFIVQDSDFLKKYPKLEEVYNGLYSTQDLKNILKLSNSEMERKISALPEGAKDSLKTIVSTMVDNGSLADVNKIKKLDSIFGTEMLIKILKL